MTINPALDVQTAMRNLLIAHPGLTALIGPASVYDDVPQGTGHPYVTIGEIATSDWSTQTRRGHEHIVTMHVWSRHKGRKQVQSIIGEIDSALDGATLTMTGHHMVNLSVIFWTALRALDSETYHGIVRARCVTEPLI